MFPCSSQINKFVPLFPNRKYQNAFQRSLFSSFDCSPRALLLVPFSKLLFHMFPEISWWALGKCVGSCHVLILEVFRSLESYFREATFFLWVKLFEELELPS